MRNFDLSDAFAASAGDPVAVEKLIEQLGDSSDSVRVHAAEFLGVSGDLRAVGPLITMLKDENLHVRWAAASALGRLGDQRAVEPLIEALADPSWAIHLRWVATALGDLGDPIAVTNLITVLGHENSEVRSAAASALARLGDPRAIPPVIDLLAGRGPRVMMALALSQFGKPAVGPLVELLKHPDKDVRFFAADALREIGDPVAASPLVELLSDGHILVRNKAVQGLVKIGPAAVPHIIERLEFIDKKGLLSACEALGEIGDIAAVELLSQLARHGDELVRARAREALAKLPP